jgi:hypothetical protein
MARSQRNRGKARSSQAKARSSQGNAPRNRSDARRKIEQIRREQRARTIRIRVLAAVGAAVVVAAAVVAIVLASGGGGKAAPAAAPTAALGPEGIALQSGPVLAPASTAATGQAVDGIQCGAEQTVYHIHTHLAVFVDGAARQIPLGIGVVQPAVSQTANGPLAAATRCYYWLHTHAADGIIHIESPTQRTYTLGNFFDIWRQPLSAAQAGPATGTVTAFVDGKKYTGDPRAIPLGDRTAIQLNVGNPAVPFKPVAWAQSQL